MRGASVVVNLVGILSEGGAQRFNRVHAHGAHAIAEAAARIGARVVHVSAIGADANSPSRYAASKAAGERAVLDAVPDATIIRPSIVFGPEDGFFNKFATMARYALSFGVHVSPMEVAATFGNSEAVNLALDALTQPGDMVAIESPTFYGILQSIEAKNLQALEIPSSPHTGMSIEALELALRTHPKIKAVVVVPHLQMPQGATMPDSHKQRLVALCRAHRVALIEDDIYREFVETDEVLRPCKAWDTDGSVIYCSSLSKSYAPGLRLGWMNAGRWHARVQMIKFARSRNLPVWPQLLGARTVGSPAYMRHLVRLRQQLRVQRQAAAQAVARYFPIGTRLSLPAGGLSIWLELPEQISSSRLYGEALALGIRVAPGDMFSNTGHYDHFLRLSCGLPFTPQVEEGYRTLGRLLHTQLGIAPRG